jgi:hypothetical protein
MSVVPATQVGGSPEPRILRPDWAMQQIPTQKRKSVIKSFLSDMESADI